MVGDNIELFNKTCQKETKFVIDGVERTWAKINDQWKELLKNNKVTLLTDKIRIFNFLFCKKLIYN